MNKYESTQNMIIYAPKQLQKFTAKYTRVENNLIVSFVYELRIFNFFL